MCFFSSNGKPPQGMAIHLAWMDEEIQDGEWFPELLARTTDTEGHIIWSGTAQLGTERFYELHLKTEKSPDIISEHRLNTEKNQHVPQARLSKHRALYTEDEARTRIEGEWAV